MLYKPWLIFLHSNPVRKVLKFLFKMKAKNYLRCFNVITKVIHGHLNIQTLQACIKRKSKSLVVPSPQRNFPDVCALSALPVAVSINCTCCLTVVWAQRGKLTCPGHPAGEGRGRGGGTCVSPCTVLRAGYAPPSGSWGPGRRSGSESGWCFMPNEPVSKADASPAFPALPHSTLPGQAGEDVGLGRGAGVAFLLRQSPFHAPACLGMRSTARSASSSPTTPPRAAMLGAGSSCLSVWAASPPLRSLLR